jgi:transcriptional antiterminator
MNNTMLIQITNQKAVGLLRQLEELDLIKVLSENSSSVKTKLSDKYKGVITKEQGKNLNEHIKQMRSEWNTI